MNWSRSDEEHGYKPDQERIEELFKQIDKNQDGIIDAEELAEGLKTLGGRYTKGQAEVGKLPKLLKTAFVLSTDLVYQIYCSSNSCYYKLSLSVLYNVPPLLLTIL